ncbi:hypothetical protein KAM467_36820 [Aeromonas caviae]|nr:hypothetical protein KAM467_36820 [Aeromonas caviae]GKR97503.1 hypothetical protein KAM485_40060 [Aeromonas caviae]
MLQLHTAIIDNLKQLVEIRVSGNPSQNQLNPLTNKTTQFDKINTAAFIRPV